MTDVIDINEAMNAAMEAALPEPVEPTEVVEEQEVTETPAVAEAATAEPVVEEPEVAEPEPEEPKLPEGVVVVPAVEGELATQFKIMDEEGEVEVPNLMIEYKANGQVRKDRLDQVVKLAQWGVYNEAREQKAKQVEQEVVEVRTQAQELEQVLIEREKQIERLLQDDEFLYSVREAYERENSPERRAERTQQEFESYKISQEMRGINEAGEQFFKKEVTPALGMIAQALPNVTSEELEERLFYAMQAHVEIAPNGQPYIPASRHDEVRKYLVEDLAVWAQIQNARRLQPTTGKQVAPASAELSKARIEAQKAKRLVGQQTKPVGKPGSMGEAPRQRKPETLDDALDAAMSSVLSAI